MTSPDLFSWLRGHVLECDGKTGTLYWISPNVGRLWPLALDVIEGAVPAHDAGTCVDCDLLREARAAFLAAAEKERA